MKDDLASPERLARWSEAFREYSRDTDPTSSLQNLTRSWRELSGRAGMIAVSVKNLLPGEFRLNKFVHKNVVPSEDDIDTPLHDREEPIQSGGIISQIIASELVYHDRRARQRRQGPRVTATPRTVIGRTAS